MLPKIAARNPNFPENWKVEKEENKTGPHTTVKAKGWLVSSESKLYILNFGFSLAPVQQRKADIYRSKVIPGGDTLKLVGNAPSPKYETQPESVVLFLTANTYQGGVLYCCTMVLLYTSRHFVQVFFHEVPPTCLIKLYCCTISWKNLLPRGTFDMFINTAVRLYHFVQVFHEVHKVPWRFLLIIAKKQETRTSSLSIRLRVSWVTTLYLAHNIVSPTRWYQVPGIPYG